MKVVIGIAAMSIGLATAALLGTLAGYLVGAALLLAPIIMAISAIRQRQPRRAPTPR